VDERCGPWRALVRSAAVTRGHRGRVLVSLGALCAVALVLAAVVVGLCVASDASVFAALVGVTWVAALPAVGAAVAYHAIRATNEAPGEAELERVFG
jgi:quinol-cytochrome oxidoreductase complex cytochrome b subunit